MKGLHLAHKRLAFIDFARSDRLACAFHVPTNLPAPPTPLIGRERDIGRWAA